MFINLLDLLGTQTANGNANSLATQFQQNLQQLEQDATSNPQAALQLLQSLPPAEQQSLMQALTAQDPQAAASLQAAFTQQEQQILGQVPAKNNLNISAMVQLAQNLGKMISGSNTHQPQPQTQTGPSDGYAALTDMTA